MKLASAFPQALTLSPSSTQLRGRMLPGHDLHFRQSAPSAIGMDEAGQVVPMVGFVRTEYCSLNGGVSADKAFSVFSDARMRREKTGSF